MTVNFESSAEDGVLYLIVQNIRKIIIERCNLEGLGDTPRIESSSVVIRGPQYSGQNEEMPGIVITWGLTADIPASGGDNCTQDVHYVVLIQIIDKQQGKYELSRIRSHIAWAERIRKVFNAQNLRNEVFDSRGYVDLALVENVKMLDERAFKLDSRCVQAIPVKVISREPIIAAGSA